MPQLNNSTELCISNNASNDGTREYLQQLESNHPEIKIINQIQQLNIDESMEAAFLAGGSGGYFYLLGDDDVLLPCAIENILEELKTGADMLLLNSFHTDKDLNINAEHLSADLKGKNFNNVAEAFYHLWDKMPFGSFVAMEECFKNFVAYRNTSHAYSGTVWNHLANSSAISIKCGTRPNLFIRGAEKTWAPQKLSILFYEIPKWFSLIEQLPKLKKPAKFCKNYYLRNLVKPENIKELKEDKFNFLRLWQYSGWRMRFRIIRYLIAANFSI